MTSPTPLSPSEWEELLAGEALGDLNAEELERLEQGAPDERTETLDDLRQVAALLDLTFSASSREEMPERLRSQILADAPKHLPVVPREAVVAESQSTRQPSSNLPTREWIAWIAAAASLLFAIGTWMTSDNGTTLDPANSPVAVTVEEAREDVLLAADQITVDWAPGTTPFDAPVDGDVVWSTSQQAGYMRFVGMPVNDPTQEQYQLWIIDPARDDEPIDGGVFDVTSTGEVIVPIDAKLTVVDPAAFAITIEKPGGVVVSTQERLPLLAPVKG
ncbi:anti-sigma factor [Rhodopirellula sallentina]|uniref:Anti-sigma K factor RskA C-terminal domain-containing protein n=1 Tax=Rhodopirellula sallentina SM41 TaxID=1263870 RepID=M5UAC4_9BACT|nr:anti-sigma factor [Rhodopirellula sallentina]EMI58244.1 hypothetical protein RSSM_00314 [Rhodopirellula sallentina SM41]